VKKGKENNDHVETSTEEDRGRNTSSLKRAPNPAVDDVGVKKKVSISYLSMEKDDTNGAPVKAKKLLFRSLGSQIRGGSILRR
jgi:hypothetical protein